MAGNYNKVLLMGNLTRDVELKYTPANMAIGKVGLAVNRRYRTADGQVKEEVTFVDCDVFGRTAETMSKFLSKGRPVFVEGHLRLDQWQDKQDGTNRTKLKVVIDNFQFIDSKGEGPRGGAGGGQGGGYSDEPYPNPPASAGRPPQQQQRGSGPSQQPPADAGYAPIEEDDIPF